MRTLCYVAAPSYSGSTLLTLLLGTHPEIATVGELKGRLYASREAPRRCSCGQPVLRCGFWREVALRLEAEGVSCDPAHLDSDFGSERSALADRLLRAGVRGPAFEGLRAVGLRHLGPARRERERLLRRVEALVEVICAIQGGSVLLDSSKEALRLLHLAESGRFALRVIHLLRDGRGVALSFRERDGLPVARGAARWRREHRAVERVCAQLPPGSVRSLHYETLATDPERELDSLLDWLELPRAGLRLDFRAAPHHVFGNPMRFEREGGIRLDERWRSALTPGERASFERVAGPFNRRYGYSP